jgi:hypothetical protein
VCEGVVMGCVLPEGEDLLACYHRPVLSVERFAALRARIEVGTPREVVLREAGLTRREWTELQRHWLDALAEAVTRGDVALAARYERRNQRAAGAHVKPSLTATAPNQVWTWDIIGA